MRNSQLENKIEGIQKMISDGAKMIHEAKQNYLRRAGHTLANPGTSSKNYWSMINSVLNKAKVPNIPPLLENGLFITDFTEKAQLFNDHFINQCMVINTGSEIPQYDASESSSLINDFTISDDKMLNIISVQFSSVQFFILKFHYIQYSKLITTTTKGTTTK